MSLTGSGSPDFNRTPASRQMSSGRRSVISRLAEQPASRIGMRAIASRAAAETFTSRPHVWPGSHPAFFR